MDYRQQLRGKVGGVQRELQETQVRRTAAKGHAFTFAPIVDSGTLTLLREALGSAVGPLEPKPEPIGARPIDSSASQPFRGARLSGS